MKTRTYASEPFYGLCRVLEVDEANDSDLPALMDYMRKHRAEDGYKQWIQLNSCSFTEITFDFQYPMILDLNYAKVNVRFSDTTTCLSLNIGLWTQMESMHGGEVMEVRMSSGIVTLPRKVTTRVGRVYINTESRALLSHHLLAPDEMYMTGAKVAPTIFRFKHDMVAQGYKATL